MCLLAIAASGPTYLDDVHIPPPGFVLPPIPDNPSEADLRRGRRIVEEVLRDFPFENEASRAHAWAAILTGVLRASIAGCTPLHVFDAPQAGTGKTLLAQLVAMISTGKEACIMTAPREDEEWRKKIVSRRQQWDQNGT